MNVKIKRLHPDAVIPQYATSGAAAFDLVAVEDVIIAPGETALVPLGFAIELPIGLEMQIRPRSGVTAKTKLRVGNAPGTVDSDFRGEVKVIVDNTAQQEHSYGYTVNTLNGWEVQTEYRHDYNTYIIRSGDRIAQGVIAPVLRVNLIETDEELSETERGAGGFGHTGVTTEEAIEGLREASETWREAMVN
ncbi:dUTP diphosphatase [Paenibacillus peoriae]|uniref:dUTP diphosphatase n=1 Tax=Paenibacillus peoriae TaxID=59893 RepID=UPI0032AFB973